MEKGKQPNSMDKIQQLQVALEKEQSSGYPSMVQLNFLKKSLIIEYREKEWF